MPVKRPRLFHVLCCAAFALPLAGCSSSAAMRSVASEEVDGREIFGDIERLEFAKSVQVRLPARLAVADAGTARTRFLGDLKVKRLQQTIEALEQDDETWSDVLSMFGGVATPQNPQHETLENLRGSASRHHADLLLVTSRRESVEEGHNALAILKLLIVPLLFLPTEEDELTVDVRGAVLDVRNGLVYTTFEDHRKRTVTSSAAGEESNVEEAMDELFGESLEKVRERIARKLRALERGQ